MKKILISAIFVFGVCLFANAATQEPTMPADTTQTPQPQPAPQPEPEPQPTEIISAMQDGGFVEVTLDALNPQVQAAVKAYEKDYDVKALAYDAEKKITKVSLSSKADESAKEVLLDDAGSEL